MPRPARGFDRPSRSWRPRLPLRWITRRRLAGSAALLAGLSIPAGLGAQAYTSYYGLDAYTTYADPYSGAQVQTVRPFWDVFGAFQRPVVSAGYSSPSSYSAPASYSASYAPAVTTASYGTTVSYGTSYYGGSSYAPSTSYYSGTVLDDSTAYYGGTVTDGSYGSQCGGSFYSSSYAGGALPYGGTTSFGAYGSSRGSVRLDSSCCPSVPACSPCSDPCDGNSCPGGNCTSYSVPGDDEVIESDPVFTDPPKDLDPVPRRRPAPRDRNERAPVEREPLEDLEPPSFEDFEDSAPSDLERPAPPRSAPEDSVRDDFSDNEFLEDDRPTGDPYEAPLDDDFGVDPMSGAGADFGDAPGSGVQPAENVAPFRRTPARIADPPGERTRPVPPTDESFPEFDAPATGNFEDSAPGNGATSGNFGSNPGGIDRNEQPNNAFGGDPDLIGRPGDGSFSDVPESPPAFEEELFPGDGFGDDPDRRDSFRPVPNSIDLTGPPTAGEEDAATGAAEPPADTEAGNEEASDEEASGDETDADSPAARLSAPAEEDGPALDGSESTEPVAPNATDTEANEPAASDSAALQPSLITAQLLREELQRTRVTHRAGRTRIARFRHRSVDPIAAPDVQIAAQ